MNRDEALFYEALEHGRSAAASAYLDRACGGDDDLRQRVERLLAAHRGPDSLLDQPANVAVATCDLPPVCSERAGQQIGPYKLIQQIGEGGMGVVYMAQQTKPVKRLVALKIIKPGMDSRQVIARFEAERQALALMDHPNIAKVLDADTTESGRPYFVMELVKGIPITTYCDEKRLTPRERLELFIPVCHAVQHAHQKGIIHRDLKPTNVLIALYDGLPVPKVIDFGVAKATGGQLTDKTLVTNFGSLIGTLEYMSPEQAELNQLDVDTRSDIYSLGVLLYELLTGDTPVDRQRLRTAAFEEKLRIIREEEAETVSNRIARTKSSHHAPRDVPKGLLSRSERTTVSELDWIVMKALEKDRSRRYETATSLAADIQRYLNDEPVQACPPSARYRFRKFARKHKPALATATATALCLLLGTTVSAWQAVRATTAEAQANANEAQAKEAAVAEAQQRQRAEANEQKANAERDEVKALADKLAAKEQQLKRTLYASSMNLAKNAWDAGHIERVLKLLERYRPQAGEIDLRGFEWRYLYKLCHPELATLNGDVAALSPNGKLLAISTNDKISVLDAQTNQELLSIKEKVWRVAFSPDSTRLAAPLLGQNAVKVWDAKNGQELHTFKGEGKEVRDVAFHPDGKRLATVEVEKGVIVRNSETGEKIYSVQNRLQIISLAFSPDGTRLVTNSYQDAMVWDAQSGKELFPVRVMTSGYIVFSPDGNRLACGNNRWDNDVKLWDAHNGQELTAFKGHTATVNGAAFSPDGKRLATGSYDNTVKLWDAETGQNLFTFKGHTGRVRRVTFNHDGTRLVSQSGDGTIKIWDTSSKQEAPAFSEAAGGVSSLAVSADGNRVAGITRDEMTKEYAVKLWEARSGKEILSLKRPAEDKSTHTTLWVVAISPDGTRLAAGSGTRTRNGGVHSGDAKIWDAQTGQEITTLKGHTFSVVDLAFSPDSSRIVTCGSDTTIVGGPVQGQPCEVIVWDAQSGNELQRITGHQSFVDSVAYSPDGKRLATLSRDNSLKLWDTQTYQETLSLSVLVGIGGKVAFSPDGKKLASTNNPSFENPSQAGDIKLWDSQTGAELLTLRGHAFPVATLAFSPDGERLASAMNGDSIGRFGPPTREVKLWDTQSGEELVTFDNVGKGGVAFSPDGNRLITGDSEGLKILNATPVSNP